ncbi:MAG: site-specific DNA-methyltransferase, partial [Clostridia bacterium]|nr:site-specific DNA-methyltransferase [Clostridia bacterium]
ALEEIDEPLSKRGDIYVLGAHRLMCGDSTSSDDLKKLLDGNLVELVVTDPPYNMAYEGAGRTPKEKREKNKILNDNMPDDDFETFLTDVYATMHEGMKDGASCYVFYKELGNGVFITTMAAGGLTFKQELIWVKNQIVLGGSKYQNMYEPCLFGCKGKTVASWYGKRKQKSVIEDVDLMNEFELRDAIKELLEEQTPDIIRENKTLKNDLHPTMKPIKLLAKFIKNSSRESDSILDLFGGSGSTLIACEQLKRACYMLELDPKYCDVIVKRWESLTGNKAQLIQ